MAMKEDILSEIKRLANITGTPPGNLTFAKQTGIKEHRWSGVFWAKWSDALRDAGFESNSLQGPFVTEDVLSQLVNACRHYKHVPSAPEMRLFHKTNPLFPSHNTINNHFPNRKDLVDGLARHVAGRAELQDIAAMLPTQSEVICGPAEELAEGFVYLLKSGTHYKIGRSDQIERRIKQITISLPESVDLVHAIKTDDPPGIEAYWHRRFASLRANGEWFKLGPAEVKAFSKRKYQ